MISTTSMTNSTRPCSLTEVSIDRNVVRNGRFVICASSMKEEHHCLSRSVDHCLSLVVFDRDPHCVKWTSGFLTQVPTTIGRPSCDTKWDNLNGHISRHVPEIS